MKTIKDIFSLNLGTKVGATQFYNIINRYIINKKDKKELFKEIKNINKGEDSFDYGLEYYLTNGIEFPDAAVLHYIYKSPDQKCKLFTTAPPQGVIAVAVPTKLYVAPDMTAKDMLGTAPEILEAATQIAAKEYYSLLD